MADFNRGGLDSKRVAMNQITTKSWGLADAIKGYSRHGVRRLAVWRDKLADFGLRNAAHALGDHGMRAIALTPVRVSLDPTDNAALDDAYAAVDEAAEIDAQSLLLLASPPSPVAADDVKRILIDRLNALAVRTPPGLQLVLEPLHPNVAADISPLTTLRAALDVADDVKQLGVAVDVYNLWWDLDLRNQIVRAGDRLKALHVSDWLPGVFGGRNDRGMMGDGCIDIRSIRTCMDEVGYQGPVEVEIFSEFWWKKDPDEVVRISLERVEKFC